MTNPRNLKELYEHLKAEHSYYKEQRQILDEGLEQQGGDVDLIEMRANAMGKEDATFLAMTKVFLMGDLVESGW
jgi:hypothetical protein|tara:strand:- start:813 stop:1034 length:222 start_codon:yes stop_codon:yes gene_type:complete